jgi:ATP synthase protein I
MTSENRRELQRTVEEQASRIARAERERRTLLAQTAYLGTLGLLLVLPAIAGAYLGRWLDSLAAGYSIRWTISLILIGLAIGATNVYLFVRR